MNKTIDLDDRYPEAPTLPPIFATSTGAFSSKDSR